jgi:hypothetical protein
MPEQHAQVDHRVAGPVDRPTPALGDTCLYVVGMHRSGTSATSGLLSQLGLGMPREDDLMNRGARRNQRGHWESKSINRFDERLLVHLGGSWSAPPVLSRGWANDPGLDPLRVEASAIFSTTFGPRPIAWKDPRACILLPFWRTVIRPPVAAIFVYRNPLEVATSLRTRSGLVITHGIALWERYIRSAAAALEGIPTFLMGYTSLLESPDRRCAELVAFLDEVSVTVDHSRKNQAVGFLDGQLRHERASDTTLTVPESARELLRTMDTLPRTQHPWKVPDLGEEALWVDDMLATCSELEAVKRRYSAIRSSRSMQWAGRLEKLRRVGRAKR